MELIPTNKQGANRKCRSFYTDGLKGHVQKYMFFLYYVKSGVENEFEISFVQFDLF